MVKKTKRKKMKPKGSILVISDNNDADENEGFDLDAFG